jgi:AcrR family transcriptional regulator
MARTAENHEHKKRELLEYAEKLFVEKGYEQTSIDDILKASGISKGGFYHYFKSKEDILSESISNIIDEAVRYLNPVVNDKELDALSKFRLFMIKKNEFQSSKLEYAALLARLLQSDISQYKYSVVMAAKMIVPFAKIIEQGAAEGVFKVDYPLQTADILIRAIISVTQSPLLAEYLSDQEKQRQYQIALKQIIAKTLGISDDKFSLYGEDV